MGSTFSFLMFFKALIASISGLIIAVPAAMAHGHGTTADGPVVEVKQIMGTSKTLEGDSFSYPEGVSELRLYRVSFPPGTGFPLHTHPMPLTGYIQQGKIALVKPGGKKYVFLSGESFVIADQTPAHTMENVGEGYAVMLVNAVAAEGLETVVMAKP